MIFSELFDQCIEFGTEADYRGKAGVQRVLARNRKAYAALSPAEKRRYDKDRLAIPFGDARIECGDPKRPIKQLIAAIDIEEEQVLEAKRLNDQGWKIDLLFSHHPKSLGYFRGLPDALVVEATSLVEFYDIPLMSARKVERVAARLAAGPISNPEQPRLAMSRRVKEMAELWGLCLCSVHTPCDNHLFEAIAWLVERGAPKTLGEFVEMANDIPEYRRARREDKTPAEILVGEPGDSLGKIWYALTGAVIHVLEEEVVQELKRCGFRTIIGVIGGPKGDIAKVCRKHRLNAVLLPHDPSDNLGINLLLDKLHAREPGLDILCTRRFYRVEQSERRV